MKKRSLLLFLLLLAVASAAPAQLRLPAFKKVVLPNGLTLLLMERHGVPLISFEVTLRTGSTEDPQGKGGLASATNDLLRKGTSTRTAEQVSAELDFMGGTLATSESTDFLRLRAEFMTRVVRPGLALISDLVRHPTFPQTEVGKLLKKRVDEIRAAKDEAQAVVPEYYDAFLYGKHPYGRAPGGDERSLPAIAREDIVKFFEQHYTPGNMVIAAVGDFSTPEMEKLLATDFGALPRKPLQPAPVPDPAEPKGSRLLLVDKPDSTQTFFRIGGLGITRNNPDRVAVELVNTLFGGRFTSMLNSALRINSGLTYGARSGFDRRRLRGPFFISSFTRNQTTEQAMDMALAVLKELREKGSTEKQLQSAKNYLKGQYPPRIETNDALASLLVDFELYGLDEKEVNDYYARLDAVTLADAERVIRRYYPQDNLVFTVIGKAAEIGPLMKKYAPVETKSISAPGY